MNDWRNWTIGALGALVMLSGTLVAREIETQRIEVREIRERVTRLETMILPFAVLPNDLSEIKSRLTRIETKLDTIERSRQP